MRGFVCGVPLLVPCLLRSCIAGASSSGGVEIVVLWPKAGGAVPVPVMVSLHLEVRDEGDLARGLRAEPGAYAVCYGLQARAPVACIGLASGGVLPVIEASHLEEAIGAVVVLEAWLERAGERFNETVELVPFKAVRVGGDDFKFQDGSEVDEPDVTAEVFRVEHVGDASNRSALERGFALIPQLVPAARARNVAGYIDEFLAARGERDAYHMRGAAVGGWYVSDWLAEPGLAHLLEVVTADARLSNLLRTQLGDDFVLLERCELLVARGTSWHADLMHGPMQRYAAEAGIDPSPRGAWQLDAAIAEEDERRRTTTNDDGAAAARPRVLTVLVLFREHSNDGDGVKVVPYSHLLENQRQSTTSPAAEYVRTQPGDAVVLDHRLLHRGLRLDSAAVDFLREPNKEHRSVLTLCFGRRDAYGEAYSRAFRLRARLFCHASTLCAEHRDRRGDVDFTSRCVAEAIEDDIAKHPMQGTPDARPWLHDEQRATTTTTTMRRVPESFAALLRNSASSTTRGAVSAVAAAQWPTVLIVGASRGIGHELARQYADAGWSVHATVRDAASAKRLPRSVRAHIVDVTRTDDVAELAIALSTGDALDVLVHCAGLLGDDANVMHSVNAEAPIRVAEALLPALARSRRRTLALVSSGLGSRAEQPRADAANVGAYARSKLALNDRFRDLEPSWRAQHGVKACLLSPGSVRTDMNPHGDIPVAEAARNIIRLLESLHPDHAGNFLNLDGTRHPW